MGKASQLSLVKIRKSMTKENRRIKGSCLKAAEKHTRVKHESIAKRGCSFHLENSENL